MASRPGETIDDTAAQWLARMAAGEPSETDREGLAAWLAADSRHQGAYLRAQAMWHMLDVAADVPAGTGNASLADDNVVHLRIPSARSSFHLTRRQMIGGAGALAASLAAALYLPGILLPERLSLLAQQREAKSFALPDGSRVLLDAGSRVDVVMHSSERDLALREGKGWFQVAKDKKRPFVVDADGVKVVAVGTAFSVSREDGEIRVIVTEGVVKLFARGSDQPVFLRRNDSATITRSGSVNHIRLSDEQIRLQLAWREGSIGLDGETLQQAAARFNRYNDIHIVIDSPGLAGQRIVGLFSRNDPRSFAEASATMLGAKVSQQGNEIHLTDR